MYRVLIKPRNYRQKFRKLLVSPPLLARGENFRCTLVLLRCSSSTSTASSKRLVILNIKYGFWYIYAHAAIVSLFPSSSQSISSQCHITSNTAVHHELNVGKFPILKNHPTSVLSKTCHQRGLYRYCSYVNFQMYHYSTGFPTITACRVMQVHLYYFSIIRRRANAKTPKLLRS